MLYINETWPLPKPNKGKHLQLRLANAYDFQSVMMVSADVYFGYDYLPYAYNKWILESKVYILIFKIIVGSLAGQLIGGQLIEVQLIGQLIEVQLIGVN